MWNYGSVQLYGPQIYDARVRARNVNEMFWLSTAEGKVTIFSNFYFENELTVSLKWHKYKSLDNCYRFVQIYKLFSI